MGAAVVEKDLHLGRLRSGERSKIPVIKKIKPMTMIVRIVGIEQFAIVEYGQGYGIEHEKLRIADIVAF
jgi:hypothetical protein